LENGEPGIYLTLEQKEDEIIKDVMKFGWDKKIKKYIAEGKLIIYSQHPTSIEELKETTRSLIGKNNAKRFVLDSLSIATMSWKVSSMDIGKIRSEIFDFIMTLKNLDVTSLLITEIPESRTKSLSRFGFEEFIADGVIILHYLEYAAGGLPRSMIIRKMRRTKHGTDIYPFEIGDEGIKILPVKKGIVV